MGLRVVVAGTPVPHRARRQGTMSCHHRVQAHSQGRPLDLHAPERGRRPLRTWTTPRWSLLPTHHPVPAGSEHAIASWRGGRKQTTVWEFASPNLGVSPNAQSTTHASQKPVEVYEIPIRNHTGRGDYVLDLFCGSGTAIVAAESLQRRCLGMEIDPRFCDISVQRWEKFTGKKARRYRSKAG